MKVFLDTTCDRFGFCLSGRNSTLMYAKDSIANGRTMMKRSAMRARVSHRVFANREWRTAMRSVAARAEYAGPRSRASRESDYDQLGSLAACWEIVPVES